MQTCPDLAARLPDHTPERAARVTQGHHEQPGFAIAAARGIQRESALAVIDLGFFPGQKLQSVELLRLAFAHAAAETLDAVIAALEIITIHQFLVDRCGVATQANLGFDPRPVQLAG